LSAYSPDPASVSLEFFVMSLCPDYHSCARRFFPSLARLFPIINLKLNFIVYSSGGQYECMHGMRECQGNRAQLCAEQQLMELLTYDSSSNTSPVSPLTNSYLPSDEPLDNPLPLEAAHFYFEKYLQFLLCMNGNQQNLNACSKKFELREESIRACMRDEGQSSALMTQSAKRIQETNQKRSCTILINQEYWCKIDGQRWYNCQEGESSEEFIKAVCKRYKGNQKIPACQNS
jgi:hypothetical protein